MAGKSRFKLLSECVTFAFEAGRYNTVVEYDRIVRSNGFFCLFTDKQLMMIAKSYIITRNTRGFYKIADSILRNFPGNHLELGSYLRKRRESVREYLLFGSFSEADVAVSKSLKYLQDGVSLNDSVRHQLRRATVLKMVNYQSKYSNRKDIDSKKLRQRIQWLLG